MANFQRTFKLTSAGVAYNLDVGFVPTRVKILNYTKWATDGTNCEFEWVYGMGDGYALAQASDIASLDRSIITSNGVTVYNTDSITANYASVSGITAANPPVVTTSAAHGFTTGHRVRFANVGGMTEVNQTSEPYKITVASTTTFSLQDKDGVNVDGTGFTTYTSGGEAYDITKEVNDAGFKGVTLGTSVIGADSDVLYVECFMDDLGVKDLGDIA